jgi:hypothetical protein
MILCHVIDAPLLCYVINTKQNLKEDTKLYHITKRSDGKVTEPLFDR